MTTLVLGADGQVGSALRKTLADDGTYFLQADRTLI